MALQEDTHAATCGCQPCRMKRAHLRSAMSLMTSGSLALLDYHHRTEAARVQKVPGETPARLRRSQQNFFMTKTASSMALAAARCNSVDSQPWQVSGIRSTRLLAAGIERISAGSPVLASPERTEWSRPLPASEGRCRQPG